MTEASEQVRELLAQIGHKLKAAREARGLTLQEISARTRIHQGFLEKIEQGETEGLPGMAFVKGFLRNFIQVLELNDPELEQDIQRLNPQGGAAVAQTMPQVNVLETEPASANWPKITLWVLLGVLIVWVGYMLVLQPSTPTQPTAPATAESPATQPPSAPSAGGQTTEPPGQEPASPQVGQASQAGKEQAPETTPPTQPSPQPAASAPASAVKPGPLGGRQKLKLTIRGLERTWVRLSIDRAPPVDVLMNPAETVGWEANQEFRLTVGKSNGVAVYLNGEEILLPQERNRLVPDIVLNKLTLLRLEN